MTGPRLSIALDEVGLALPEGRIVVFHPTVDTDLSALPKEQLEVVTGFRLDFEALEAQGYDCVTAAGSGYDAAIVCLSRSRRKTQGDIAAAARLAPLVIVDGAKKDGVDAVLRECRKRVEVSGPVNKAHGKLFWFKGADVFGDWAQDGSAKVTEGFVTQAGVFSADGIDPASAALADILPEKLGRAVADLGAGWGYLSARALERSGIATLHLVEAEHDALSCARQNVQDARAVFHWADARTWAPPDPIDAVIMNPPFHTGRNADPSLGRDFIRAAARIIKPSGQLWMVANRHLPYETTLAECFADVTPLEGDGRFKLFHARRPSRQRR